MDRMYLVDYDNQGNLSERSYTNMPYLSRTVENKDVIFSFFVFFNFEIPIGIWSTV